MRRLAVAAAVLALVAPACGGGDDDGDRSARGASPPAATLAYFPRGGAGVALVPTDLGGSQLRRLAELVDRARGAGVAWADLSTISPETLRGVTLVELKPPGELVAELEASTEGLEGRLRVEVPGGLE